MLLQKNPATDEVVFTYRVPIRRRPLPFVCLLATVLLLPLRMGWIPVGEVRARVPVDHLSFWVAYVFPLLVGGVILSSRPVRLRLTPTDLAIRYSFWTRRIPIASIIGLEHKVDLRGADSLRVFTRKAKRAVPLPEDADATTDRAFESVLTALRERHPDLVTNFVTVFDREVAWAPVIPGAS